MRAAQIPDYMDCGWNMANIIKRGQFGEHLKKYEECMSKLEKIEGAC